MPIAEDRPCWHLASDFANTAKHIWHDMYQVNEQERQYLLNTLPQPHSYNVRYCAMPKSDELVQH